MKFPYIPAYQGTESLCTGAGCLAEKKRPAAEAFFNTSGILYRQLNLKDKLASMSEEEQLALLATDGMLVKRPLVIGDTFVLVGFREKEWLSAFFKIKRQDPYLAFRGFTDPYGPKTAANILVFKTNPEKGKAPPFLFHKQQISFHPKHILLFPIRI